MTLRDYFLSLSKKEKGDFASRCKTTIGYIQQIYIGNRPCNAALAIRFDKESGGKIKCDDLCPDVDFDYLRKQAA